MGTEQNPPSPSAARPSAIRAFFSHLLTMPRLHKKLLTIAVLLAGGGTVGQMAGCIADDSTTVTQQQANSASVDGLSSIVSSSQAEPVVSLKSEPTVTERLSPVAQKLGFGFIAGFVVGWAFRAFVKIMGLITMAGVTLFVGLSWLGVDLSAMRDKFESGMGWVSQQGDEWSQKVLARLPSGASAVAGIFFGFKRKK